MGLGAMDVDQVLAEYPTTEGATVGLHPGMDRDPLTGGPVFHERGPDGQP